jgi:hypothetical protein
MIQNNTFKIGAHVKWRPMIHSSNALRHHKLNATGVITDTAYGAATGELVTVCWAGGYHETVSTRDISCTPN